jgi:predicted DNA-binding protein
MNTKTRTYRIPVDVMQQLDRLSKYYNRTKTDMVCIAIGNMYFELPDIMPEDTDLLTEVRNSITSKYNINVREYCGINGISISDFYRTIRQVVSNKGIRGFGNYRDTKRDRESDVIFKTRTAQIAFLLQNDLGIKCL